MSELKIRRRERPEGEEPMLLVDRFLSDWESQYMDEHGWYALTEEYEARFGKPYPGLCEHDVSVEEYMADLRAVFDGEDIEAIIKKHPQPEPMSIEDILELLKHRKGVE